MPWTEPKTDWVSTDYFLLQDWQRIVNNGLYLYSYLNATFEWRDCNLNSTTDLPYYDIVNKLEDNLEDLSKVPNLASTLFVPTIWYPRTHEKYTHNPSFEDFTRWEKFEYDLLHWNEILRRQLNNLVAGYATSGTDRLRQYFARR